MILPILRDFPDQFETERLLICAPRAGDGKLHAEAHGESYPELKAWMLWALENPTSEDGEIYARGAAAKFASREDLVLFLFDKNDGVFVGSSGLNPLDWDVPSFEIGYWLRTSKVGYGYMTEAVQRITRFAFETLQAERVEIQCNPRNEKSAAVARRAGFIQEGHLRHNARDAEGRLSDTLIFGILRENYTNK
jgi:ribosomal-protein-serine acetyltransferase